MDNEELAKLGAYTQAIELLEQEKEKCKDIPKKTEIIEKIKLFAKYSNKYRELEIGQALFPAYFNDSKRGTILKIVVTKEVKQSSKFVEIDKSKIINSVNTHLEKNLKKISKYHLVNEWKTAQLKIYVELPPNSSNNFPTISGESFQYAAVMALFSIIFETEISNQFVFTGNVTTQNGEIKFVEVEGIDVKSEIVKKELGDDATLFSYPNNLQLENFFEFHDLDKYENQMERKVAFHIPLKNGIIKELNAKVQILKIDFSKIKNESELKLLYRFIKEQVKEICDINSDGLILNGNMPIFFVGMLLPELKNNIKGFVAINSTHFDEKVKDGEYDNDSKKIEKCVIVYTHAASEYIVGQLLNYKLEN